MKQNLNTHKAPAAIGPYVQGKLVNNFVYTSGQLPINPENSIMPESIEEQTKQCLENVKAILEAAGASLNDVVKSTVYLNSMDDFEVMNSTYLRYFNVANYPARTCVEVARLPMGAKVEIEVVAYKD